MTVNIDFSVLDKQWNQSLPNFKKIISNASNNVFDELNQFKDKNYEISFMMVDNKYIKELNSPGAILFFLPGWNVIFALMRHLNQHPVFGGRDYRYNLFIFLLFM